MKREVSICWLRRDLRLNDHAALHQALSSNYPVLLLFIFDPGILDKLSDKNDRRVTFIHQALRQLSRILRNNGSGLYVMHKPVQQAFEHLSDEFIVKGVYANHDYEPYAIDRDSKIKEVLENKGIPFYTYKDQVIFEKSEVMKSDGTPYTVFTPFSKRWKERYAQQKPDHYPSEALFTKYLKMDVFPFPSLETIGFEETEEDYPELNISEELIRNYHETRNLPALKGTSQASVHLRFGTISIRHLVKLAIQWNDQWLNELIWREFFMMILFHFPQVVNSSFKKKYDQIPWRNDEKEFQMWCRGKTGYPIVDAGMRQLNESGWMHNRVRMIAAGFLCKHLLIDWRWGESYFAQKLLDYELSSNNGNWQWAAGSGCDAAPYFRIFNPEAQTLKFDPKLKYIKTWIKDHQADYLTPIVKHDFARKRALLVYKNALYR